ncbi:IS110 family transposase [Micromonospora sicca]|uniref:IS110 family transposase n=2 Tax=Micromonospora sicca TaxID=2202420 RepID=A0A317D8X2_9ACTN|nr:IS110 family transposase [Micromonospora sp. 4G51]
MEIMYENAAGIDVHKKQITVAVRTPGARRGRHQQVRRYATFFTALREMVEWLTALGVTHVAMEATGIYWRPVWHALAEAERFEVLVCNAAHVKNVPGRKTDVGDAAWLAQLLEVGLLRGSFTPPEHLVAIRDLTRYRSSLVQERTRETQRLCKVLEDAGIKVDSVASESLGVSARHMIEALVSGERDPAVLAELARGRLRKKIPDLTLALGGRFNAHHGLMCRLHLDHIDHLAAAIGRVEAQVETMIVPFEVPRRRLCTVPGIAERASAAIISEIGVDMSWFPSGGHLASWIGLCPGNHESAGKRKTGKARKGNQYLKSVFVEAAWAAVRTDTRLKARYQRLLRRFGGARNQVAVKKAIVAIAHTLCVIVWHLLHAGVDYTDLGADYYTRRDNPEIRKNQLIRQLQELGYTVELALAA